MNAATSQESRFMRLASPIMSYEVNFVPCNIHVKPYEHTRNDRRQHTGDTTRGDCYIVVVCNHCIACVVD